MFTSFRLRCTVLFLIAMVPLGGCLTPRAPLRIAANPWPGYAFLFLAEERGYFEEEGVDVKLLEFTSLGDVRRTFELGSVDVMACTLIELVLVANQTELDPHVVLVADYSNGSDVLVADQRFTRFEELIGARVGVEPGTLDIVSLHASLKHHGLDLSAVKTVPVTQSEIPAAFAERRIDAAWCYPPISSRLTSNPDLQKLFDSSQIPRTIVDVIAVSGSSLAKRPEDIRALYRAYFRAVDFYHSQPAEAIACMASRTGLSPAELQESLAGIELIAKGDQRSFLKPGGDLDKATSITGEAVVAAGMMPGNLKAIRLRRSVIDEGVQ